MIDWTAKMPQYANNLPVAMVICAIIPKNIPGCILGNLVRVLHHPASLANWKYVYTLQNKHCFWRSLVNVISKHSPSPLRHQPNTGPGHMTGIGTTHWQTLTINQKCTQTCFNGVLPKSKQNTATVFALAKKSPLNELKLLWHYNIQLQTFFIPPHCVFPRVWLSH